MLDMLVIKGSYFPLIVVTVLYAKVGLLTTRFRMVLHQLLVLVPLLVALAQAPNPILRNLIALLPVILIAMDITLSMFSWREYRSRFSHGFALSMLETSRREVTGMLGIYRRYILTFVLTVAAIFTAVNTTPVLPGRVCYLPSVFLAIVLLVYTVQALLHQQRKNSISSPLQRIVSDLPFSNLNPFLQAHRDKSMIARVSHKIPEYDLSVKETGIDIYVVVIGESARPANMSIYGYYRPTTLFAESEQDNMLLFTQAISGSPVTATAVPLALTAATVKDMAVSHYSDNIINIANQGGFETHWYSAQGMYGDYSNAITGIAMNAHHQEWVKEGYDDALLPLLDNALQGPGKKLIVLHLYGSHPPANQRYPESERYFHDNHPDDEYDNSIRFTDKLLGQIVGRLQGSRASLLYFSDHGLERGSGKNKGWQHGGVKPLREAFQVPMFIWYSPLLTTGQEEKGKIKSVYSTVNNYALITHWLGVAQESETAKPVKELARENENSQVIDTTAQVYRWTDLEVLR
ncbi:phosphoethanolamine transferase [Citrobacter braakii]|uniref:phosphoethanolamine transferase n=1 Tax=Citrobacter braakii TaxID=57706 RepID=UPI003D9714FC